MAQHVVPELVSHQRGQVPRVEGIGIEVEITLAIGSADAEIGPRLDGHGNPHEAVGRGGRVGKPLDVGQRVLLLRREADASATDEAEQRDGEGETKPALHDFPRRELSLPRRKRSIC